MKLSVASFLLNNFLEILERIFDENTKTKTIKLTSINVYVYNSPFK
jgi:hypothetical protein